MTTAMMGGSGQGGYSDDDIEEILGMGAPEVNALLKQAREIVRENPLLVTGLAFAFGLLLGASFGRDRERCC